MTQEDKELKAELYKQSDELQKLHNKCIQLVKKINARCKHEDYYQGSGGIWGTAYECKDCGYSWEGS